MLGKYTRFLCCYKTSTKTTLMGALAVNKSFVAMTSNRTVVASLLCLVVVCHRYWNSIGDLLQLTWLKIINICGDDDGSLYFYGKPFNRSIYFSATELLIN